MADAPTAFEFLSRDPPTTVPPVCVLFGEEPLLKRESLERIRVASSTGDDDDELSLTRFDGKTVEAREVFDELATMSMFGGGRRMVVVEDADKFVTKHRERLEDYVEKPRQSSVLVLSVESWPANTRLYKKIATSGLQINCNLPRSRWGDSVDEEPVLKWLHARAKSHYQAKLDSGAAELLMEIVGPQLGRLDQELAKLSLVAESSTSQTNADQASTKTKSKSKAAARVIERTLVEQTVGGWRAKTAWAMIEAALEGNARDAIVQLDRLLLAGEEPIALLAMMGGSLRRLAAATRILEEAELDRRRMTLGEALVQAGVKSNKFVLGKTENQLRQIGRARAKKIFGWLLEADLALKGASSRDDRARLVLEKLIVRLSRQLASATVKR